MLGRQLAQQQQSLTVGGLRLLDATEVVLDHAKIVVAAGQAYGGGFVWLFTKQINEDDARLPVRLPRLLEPSAAAQQVAAVVQEHALLRARIGSGGMVG